MTASRDPDRLIHAFLHEGLDELPDPVYDVVRDRIEQTRQRALIGPWRTSDMNRYLKIGLAAAAVVVIAVVGFQYLGGPNTGSPGATETPQPTATATGTPAPSEAAGLPVGSSFLLSDEVPISATIPAAGWSLNADGILVKDGNSREPDGAFVLGTWAGEPLVPSDPCHWASTMPDTPATTLEEIVAALANQATRDAAASVDVTVDGHPGKSIRLHVPGDIAYSEVFTDCDETKFCTLSTDDAGVCTMWYHEPDEFSELWIVDKDGEFVFVTANYFPETPAEVIEEVQAILGSMRFSQ